MKLVKSILSVEGSDRTNTKMLAKAIKTIGRLNLDVTNNDEKYIIHKSHSKNQIVFDSGSDLISFVNDVIDKLSLKSFILIKRVSTSIMYSEFTLPTILEMVNEQLLNYNMKITGPKTLNQAVDYFTIDIFELMISRILDNDFRYSVCYGCKYSTYDEEHDCVHCKYEQIVPPNISLSYIAEGYVINGEIHTNTITYPVKLCHIANSRKSRKWSKTPLPIKDSTSKNIKTDRKNFDIDIK